MEPQTNMQDDLADSQPSNVSSETTRNESDSIMVAEQSGPAANHTTHQNQAETTVTTVTNMPTSYSPFQTPSPSGTSATHGTSDSSTHELLNMLLTALNAQTVAMNQAHGQSAEIRALNEQVAALTTQMADQTNDYHSLQSMSNPIDKLTENQIYKTVNQRIGKNKFAGKLPGTDIKGLPLGRPTPMAHKHHTHRLEILHHTSASCHQGAHLRPKLVVRG